MALLEVIHQQDLTGKWLFTSEELHALFPNEALSNFSQSLSRHIKNRLLLKITRGVYANHRAHSKSEYPLEDIIPYVRPDSLNYISGHSALSKLEIGVQSHKDNLTVMTTGRSFELACEFGTIDFIHTKRSEQSILKTLISKSTDIVGLATPTQANKDLSSINRK